MLRKAKQIGNRNKAKNNKEASTMAQSNTMVKRKDRFGGLLNTLI
jgi:hypothetical protein